MSRLLGPLFGILMEVALVLCFMLEIRVESESNRKRAETIRTEAGS